MFWRHTSWSTVDEAELPSALEVLNVGLARSHLVRFALTGVTDVTADLYAVRSLRVRSIPFYADHWLYELNLAVSDNDFSGRYSAAQVFAIVAPDPADAPASDAEAAIAVHRRRRQRRHPLVVTLLDWNSATIYQLNRRTRMSLLRDGAFDVERAVQYLDFFTSFLVGDSRTPFLLVRDGSFAEPGGIASVTALPSFEDRIADILNEPYRRPSGRWDPSREDEPDMRVDDGPAAAEPGAAEPAPAEPGAAEPALAAPGAAAQSETAARTIDDIRVEREEPERKCVTMSATVLYDGVYFRAWFELSETASGDTDVIMTDDTPLMPGGSLARYRVDELGGQRTPVLVRPPPRTEINARDFIDGLRRSAGRTASMPQLENLRVRGEVDLRTVHCSQGLWIRDVEFLNSVVLDDSRRTASVNFGMCKFAQQLTARNLSLEGDLILKGAVALGATRRGDRLAPSICLDGARITGSLDAPQLGIDGYLSATNAVITGAVRLNGVSVRARRPGEDQALSFPDARVESGIYLGPAEETEPPNRSRYVRSYIERDVNLYGVKTSEVKLCGMVCRALDLSYAAIGGLLDLNVHVISGSLQHIKLFRTRVDQAELRYAHAKEIFLVGAQILGSLSLLQTQVAGSVFASSPQYIPFRTVIGADLVLSGAQIGGDCDFCGARIAGRFEMRTGAVNRLFLRIHPVVIRGAGVVVDHFATEVGSIEVISVSGLKVVDLGGIIATGDDTSRSDELCAVTLEHLQVQGDIRFYWGIGLTTQFDEAWRSALADDPRAVRRRDASATTCSAMIAGSLAMRRLGTSGRIDLTNVKVVDGQISLADSRIGTDLFARCSALRGKEFRQGDGTDARLALVCGGLDLDGAKVEGDVILTGLELRAGGGHEGNLRGRGLQVAGKLEFCAGRNRFATIAGKLQLSGARAAYLTLHEASWHPPATAPGGSALPGGSAAPAARHGPLGVRADLARSKLGVLHVEEYVAGPGAVDLELEHVDLTGAEVASWGGLSAVEDYLRILSKLKMDRTVWMAVEAKLRNESKAGDADRIYRAMMMREPVRGVWLLWKWTRWLFWGFGTRVWPSLIIALVLASLLFLVLANPANVKVSPGVFAQLNATCRAPRAALQPAPQPRCEVFEKVLAGGGSAAAVQFSAAQLQAHDYDVAAALYLTVRYALPGIGAFGDSDWAPLSSRPLEIGSYEVWPSPAMVATLVRLINALLLAFAIAFITRRWLR